MDFKVGDEVDILSESVFYSGKVVDILKSGQRVSLIVMSIVAHTSLSINLTFICMVDVEQLSSALSGLEGVF